MGVAGGPVSLAESRYKVGARHASPRDVDLTLLTGFGGEAAYIETLPGGIGVDIFLGALPFEHLVYSEPRCLSSRRTSPCAPAQPRT
jgi:hypothetical protein